MILAQTGLTIMLSSNEKSRPLGGSFYLDL
ncbi:hypothetical protein TRM7615_03020 [Falsiruegeria mediterranea M17]|uniref:Uncharacterized protein n=1 Tax=Falsiruegeria mediterranea M17 TaxID=1200281 RepID=A0A2R8CAP1_9RHOB|nr:hypothetical protein TRM7615_03020 [Falsiruegeria mediterranea M17]